MWNRHRQVVLNWLDNMAVWMSLAEGPVTLVYYSMALSWNHDHNNRFQHNPDNWCTIPGFIPL